MRACVAVFVGVFVMLGACAVSACTCIVFNTPVAIPAGGTVPANLPGVLVGTPQGGDPSNWRLTRVDKPEPLEVSLRDANSVWPLPEHPKRTWSLLVPAKPLVAGARYKVGLPHADGHMGHEVTFEVGQVAPLPKSLGAVRVGPVGEGELQVAAGGSCSAKLRAAHADVRLSLSSDARPWADAMLIGTRVDSQLWNPKTSICAQTTVGESWQGRFVDKIHAACGLSMVWQSLKLGRRRVTMRAWVPGAPQALESKPDSVRLICAKGSGGPSIMVR